MNKERTQRMTKGLPEEELIDLSDMTFDFEDYFNRHHDGEMDDAEKEEFSARVYGLFCQSVFNSGGDSGKIPFWAANYIAEKLVQVLGGVPWPDVMRLPWDVEEDPFFTPKGERAVNIYAEITNALSASPDANVTTLIAEQAGKHCVSYETARADYYAFKKAVSDKSGLPDRFLNKSGRK